MYKYDKLRKGALPLWQYWFRKANKYPNIINKIIFRVMCFLYHIEISHKTSIGRGLYVGHPMV